MKMLKKIWHLFVKRPPKMTHADFYRELDKFNGDIKDEWMIKIESATTLEELEKVRRAIDAYYSTR